MSAQQNADNFKTGRVIESEALMCVFAGNSEVQGFKKVQNPTIPRTKTKQVLHALHSQLKLLGAPLGLRHYLMTDQMLLDKGPQKLPLLTIVSDQGSDIESAIWFMGHFKLLLLRIKNFAHGGWADALATLKKHCLWTHVLCASSMHGLHSGPFNSSAYWATAVEVVEEYFRHVDPNECFILQSSLNDILEELNWGHLRGNPGVLDMVSQYMSECKKVCLKGKRLSTTWWFDIVNVSECGKEHWCIRRVVATIMVLRLNLLSDDKLTKILGKFHTTAANVAVASQAIDADDPQVSVAAGRREVLRIRDSIKNAIVVVFGILTCHLTKRREQIIRTTFQWSRIMHGQLLSHMKSAADTRSLIDMMCRAAPNSSLSI